MIAHSNQRTFRTSKARPLLRLILLLTLITLFFCQAASAAVKADIRDIVVNNSNDQLLLYLTVAKAFRPEMEEGIMNGIPASFTFFVSLREMEDGRPGKQVVSVEFDHVLSYDSLKEVFNLRFSETNTSFSLNTLTEAKNLMTEVNGFRIVDLTKLRPDARYFLSVKVRLERKTLPLFFHYLIPFWQLRDEETDWYYVEFKY